MKVSVHYTEAQENVSEFEIVSLPPNWKTMSGTAQFDYLHENGKYIQTIEQGGLEVEEVLYIHVDNTKA